MNFDHLRHYKQGKNKSIVLEAKKNAWFGDGEHRNILAQWTLIANEEGQLDEKLRSWRSKYKDEIEEEATNEGW